MTPIQAAAIYVALHLVVLLYLALRVIAFRRKNMISLGDNSEFVLTQRIRTHGNFVETASFALIGLLAVAMLGANVMLIHVFGLGLLVGRLLHAHGMSQKNAFALSRPIGMLTTMFVIIGEVATILYLVFS